MPKNKSMRMVFFILLLSTIAYANHGFGQESLNWLNGHWEGVGYQPPTNTSWDVVLDFDPTANSIKIQYPTLSCSGEWQLKKSSKGRAEFIEKIQLGTEKCDQDVKVIVQQIDDCYISVTYFLPGRYDGVVANAVLNRCGSSEI